ncbi:MAG TPA: PQQ-dependent sugar dehydrogenase [Pirellulales bacterium]|jgi:glucose/arabinose dehydrogenase
MKFEKILATAAVAALALTIGVARLPAAELDTRPLPIKVDVAFPQIKWPGWTSSEDSGVIDPLRPILLTHAGDGTNRVFIPTQQGVIYVLPNDQQGTKAEVFLDLHDKVSYNDKTNEEGFLGLAFHPKFRENGQFFAYYTNKSKPHQNVVARFRVSKDNPNKADPASEESLLVFDKPFWNHDGGTLAFGPDGLLYIAVGDGGLGGDPFGNGQKKSTLLGKILRIDVDHKDGDLPYAIPKDNPFVADKEARGEIYAFGLRNVWRLAFDPKTKVLWAADVGQDTWEEIDLIEKGGNYGWNIREALHPFVKKGGKPPEDTSKPAGLIDPIFEYHHDIGKSITGGFVYRGHNVPELDGAYLYADYVSGKLWALWYDADKKVVTANREIPLPKSIPVMSFGEDEKGEVYFMTYSPEGQGVYRFTRAD